MSTFESVNLEELYHDLGAVTQMQLNQIRFTFANMQIGQPLVWLYVWDTICSIYDQYAHEEDPFSLLRPGLELDEVWNELWTNHPGFTLGFGPEALEEHIEEWMIGLGYIIDREEEDEDDLDTDDKE